MDEPTLKELLLSDTDADKIRGLKRVSRDNFTLNLPYIMEIIRKDTGETAGMAVRVSSNIIMEILKDPDSSVEAGIKNALAVLLLKFEPEIIDRLRREYFSTDLSKRFDSLFLLRSINNAEAAAEILQSAFTDKNKLVRACAVKTLGMIAQKKVPNIIVTYLKDADSRVRANAVESLEETENSNNIGILLRVKKDTNNRVRGNVLKALWKFGYEDIEKDLIAMLEHDSELMRASGVWVIGEIGNESAKITELLKRVEQEKSALVKTNILLVQDKIKTNAAKNKAISRTFKEAVIKSSEMLVAETTTRYFHVLKLHGRLNVYSLIPLKLKIQSLIDTETMNIALDFSDVDDVDSAVLTFLKNVNRRIRTSGGKFMIFNTSKEIMDVFGMANIDAFVLIFSDEESVDHLLN